MTFTIQNLEFTLMVLVRISSFVMTAPFFSIQSVPARVKAGASLVMTLMMLPVLPASTVAYSGVIGYFVLILKEAVVGATLGLMCQLCLYVVNFAGQIIDMEMGLSMASMFDPSTRMQVTVTGNIYNYFVMLLLVVTNMHYYVIRAILDSFTSFPVGQAVFRTGLKDILVDFVGNYLLISLRIVLPFFCCMLIINVVLGVLSKAAPQMNMFVVGIQIKVLAGVLVLVLLIQTLPTVADFIFNEMKVVITEVYHSFAP